MAVRWQRCLLSSLQKIGCGGDKRQFQAFLNPSFPEGEIPQGSHQPFPTPLDLVAPCFRKSIPILHGPSIHRAGRIRRSVFRCRYVIGWGQSFSSWCFVLLLDWPAARPAKSFRGSGPICNRQQASSHLRTPKKQPRRRRITYPTVFRLL